MLRTGAPRLGLPSITRPIGHAARPAFSPKPEAVACPSRFSSLSFNKRPQRPPVTQFPSIQAVVFRRTLADKIDKKAEEKYRNERIEPTPETVTTTSTTRPILSEVAPSQQQNREPDIDMMKGVKQDLETVKETFSLAEVPRQAYYLGLAGVLPYLATSLSTVFCAWNINHANDVGTTVLISPQTAETMMHILEPIQIGYGAVILSFLGAIHWGLEWAGFGGYQGYRRYAIGVLAPAVAWPTMLLPVETALIAQFGAFVLLYYADTRAAYRGWTPSWYAIYRFVLTFIVGTSIVISLIGRGEVADRVKRIPGTIDRFSALRDSPEKLLAQEEEAIQAEQEKRARLVEKSDKSKEEGEEEEEEEEEASKEDEKSDESDDSDKSDESDDSDKSDEEGDKSSEGEKSEKSEKSDKKDE